MGLVSELRVTPMRYDVKDGNTIKIFIYMYSETHWKPGHHSQNYFNGKKNYVATIFNASVVTILIPPLPCITLMHLFANFSSFLLA